jgi:hypothetical protein
MASFLGPKREATSPKAVGRGVSLAGLRATQSVRLTGNHKHPTIQLFLDREDASRQAKALGAPWVPVAYACGYMLTNGWSFRDAAGPLDTFCPVTIEQLKMIVPLVSRLIVEKTPAKDLPGEILEALRPLAASLPKSVFESLCLCTLMRVGYPLPAGAEDDWLTTPAWALLLPTRKMRLNG